MPPGDDPTSARPYQEGPIQGEGGHGRAASWGAAHDTRSSIEPRKVFRPLLVPRIEQRHAGTGLRVAGFDLVALEGVTLPPGVPQIGSAGGVATRLRHQVREFQRGTRDLLT
jgi:hypothetical protein